MIDSILIKGGVFCAVVLLLCSCASGKRNIAPGAANEKRVSRVERRHTMDAVAENRLQFNTFNGRAKSRVVINGDSYDATANVRIERDKAIWISVTAIMGIEAGRVLITPDSIKVINRLQGRYISRPFEYLYQFMGRDLDFSSLQDLLMGNVIHQAINEETAVWALPAGNVLRGEAGELLYSVQIDDHFRAVLMLLADRGRGQSIEASYSSYQQLQGRLFPNRVEVSLRSEGLELDAAMSYSRISYDETLEMPFTIPSRFTEAQ